MKDIISTRIFNTNRELVFKAWSDPNLLAQWWGPRGFTNTFQEFNMRPGGDWRFIMRGPDGSEYKNDVTFVEIIKPEKIVFNHLSGAPFQVKAIFDEIDYKTKITFWMTFETDEACQQNRSMAIVANEENFDRLETVLARLAMKGPQTEIATSFISMVGSGKISEAYKRFVDPNFHHHNVYYKGDGNSLRRGMEEHAAQYPNMVVDIQRVLEDGDLVAIHSKIRPRPNELGISTVHIFRFQQNRIVEMWDIGQPVPEHSPNEYGMF